MNSHDFLALTKKETEEETDENKNERDCEYFAEINAKSLGGQPHYNF